MKKTALLLFFIGLCLCQVASAGRMTPASKVDPFKLAQTPTYACSGAQTGGVDYECDNPYQDTNGRTIRNLTLNTAVRNLIIISAGQSNRESVMPSGTVLTNGSAIDNFNIYDSANYAYAEPLLGTSFIGNADGGGPGFIMGLVADKFISGGQFDHVIIVSVAVGATDAAMWAPGGPLQGRLCSTMGRLAQRGFVAGTNVTVAMEWGLGESDNLEGTSQASFQNSFVTMDAALRACGFSGRSFIAIETWANGTTSAAIQAAQQAVVNNTTRFQSGNLDTITATGRQSNNTHFNNTGGAQAATNIYNAMHASGSPF